MLVSTVDEPSPKPIMKYPLFISINGIFRVAYKTQGAVRSISEHLVGFHFDIKLSDSTDVRLLDRIRQSVHVQFHV